MPSSDADRRAERALEGLREGDPVSGPRYEILEPLGSGAAAVVYRARDRQLDRLVALKVLHGEAAKHADVRERFRREARAVAKLSHPNVVALFDAEEVQGRLQLVMDLVDGRPLSVLIEERALDTDSAVRLLEKAARGVAAAHRWGIVHRDLKPANILVTRDGEPKVADFGVARLQGSEAGLTRPGTPIGTPLYMAPEQAGGDAEKVSPRTDVYALGAILYELLTGQPPHRGGTLGEISGNIINRPPAPPRSLNPRIPAALEAVAMRALAKDPAERYATAAEFADDLERCMRGLAPAARGPRRRLLALAIGAVAAVAVVAGVALAMRGSPRAPAASGPQSRLVTVFDFESYVLWVPISGQRGSPVAGESADAPQGSKSALLTFPPAGEGDKPMLMARGGDVGENALALVFRAKSASGAPAYMSFGVVQGEDRDFALFGALFDIGPQWREYEIKLSELRFAYGEGRFDRELDPRKVRGLLFGSEDRGRNVSMIVDDIRVRVAR